MKHRIHEIPLFLLTAAMALPACQPRASSTTPTAAAHDDGPPWSPAANGLQGRIESVWASQFGSDTVLLDVRNVGDKPITFPSLRIYNQPGDLPWQLQIEHRGTWEVVSWGKHSVSEEVPGSDFSSRDVVEKRVPVSLRPGETALVELMGNFYKEMRSGDRLRIKLMQPADGPILGWSGSLDISQGTGRPLDGIPEAPAPKRDLPTYIPEFSHIRQQGINDPLVVSQFEHLSNSNWELLRQLSSYRPEQVARELDKRLAVETDPQLKLLMAAEAARCGSAAGEAFILECRKSIDYELASSTCGALRCLAMTDSPPEWIKPVILNAVTDQRKTVNPARPEEGPTIASLAADADLIYELGQGKYSAAIPVLIKLTKDDYNSRDAIAALGDFNDPRAIAALKEIIRNANGHGKLTLQILESQDYEYALRSLTSLKAPGIEEMLRERLHNATVVQLLEYLGDRGAIPALRRIVADGMPVQIEGCDKDSNRRCVDAARLALAALEPGDPAPRYCALVADPLSDKDTRFDAAFRLRKPDDPKAIPILLRTVREDPDGMVVSIAISSLGEYKYKDAVAGLIACFSADFKGKETGKGGGTPDELRARIAESLRNITGQSFGSDQEEWRTWWQSHGKDAPWLK